MKRWKKALVSLLTGCLVCGMLPVRADASEKAPLKLEEYKYTVTLSAGNKGLINGQEKITVGEIKSLPYGDDEEITIIFSTDYLTKNVQVTDDRYYVKGVRLSGRDNEEAVSNASTSSPVFTVTGDADYVVAYGVKGEQVKYTIQYQDADGNTLAPSQEFYGNIGDKPIVAYQYIDGYIPQALALTKTLSENEAENIFTFVYTPGDPGEIVNTVTDTTTVTGDPTIVTVVVPGAGAAGGGAGGGAGAGGAAEGGEAEGGETTTIEEDQTPQGTQDIVDLDEEETPQGTMDIEDVEEEETAKGLPLAFSVGIGAVAAVVLICLVVWLLKGRKSGSDGTTGE